MTRPPPGWTTTTLGDLGSYHNGRAFKKSEWSDAGRPIIRIQNLTGSGAVFNHFEGEAEDRYVARPGDLLVSWAATLGAYIWHGPEAVVNQHIFKVISKIDVRFHKYLLDFKLAELMQHTHGSGMVHITRGRFDSLPVAVPSLVEQRRIVDVLEDHLSRLDAGLEQLRAAQRRNRSLRDAALRSELLGHRWPGDRSPWQLPAADVDDGYLSDLPAGWAWRRLQDVADVVGGVTKDASKQGDPSFVEVPYLRVANVQRGRLDLRTIARIRVPPAKLEQLRLEPGDVLLNEGGDRDKLGRGWVWAGEIEDCITQNHVFRARPRPGTLHPKLLSWAANSLGGPWCERNGKQSVNLASISLKRIRLMPVPVPPLDAQPELVQRLEDLHDRSARLDTVIEGQLARGAALRRSLLASAFSGRL